MAIKVTGNIVITDAQAIANITTISANGNANVGNLGTAQVLATANITAPQLISNVTTGTAPLVVTSTTVVANLNANAIQGNTPASTATANSIVQRNADGNITANFFIGNGSQLTGIAGGGGASISNGTSNVNIATSGGNVTVGVGGTAAVATFTTTGANITGTANVTGNANVGNLGAAQVLATANVTAPVLISNVTTGTAPLTVTSTTQVANLSVATAGTATSATTAGTVTTNAQPNITSVGTLSGLTVSATISGSVSGSAATFTSTSQNSQFNSIGVGTGASGTGGEIRATNNITAYYSDRRLKKDIKKISNALDKLDQLTGVYFKSNKTAAKYGYKNSDQQIGVLAQEVQAVVPEAVTYAPFDRDIDQNGVEFSKSGENYLTVWYEKLIPLLLEGIKELRAEVEELKAKQK